jgi:hypothetical protein
MLKAAEVKVVAGSPGKARSQSLAPGVEFSRRGGGAGDVRADDLHTLERSCGAPRQAGNVGGLTSCGKVGGGAVEIASGREDPRLVRSRLQANLGSKVAAKALHGKVGAGGGGRMEGVHVIHVRQDKNILERTLGEGEGAVLRDAEEEGPKGAALSRALRRADGGAVDSKLAINTREDEGAVVVVPGGGGGDEAGEGGVAEGKEHALAAACVEPVPDVIGTEAAVWEPLEAKGDGVDKELGAAGKACPRLNGTERGG